jgi:tetratricopeptide (TPR) repeat protein
MSPEQIKSTKDVTLQSDIYSLGVVLWQMVMGKKPYDTNTTSTFELQTKIVTEKLSLTNSSFDTIIGGATEKEVSKRFKCCKTIKSKIDNLQKKNLENTTAYTLQDSEKTIVDNSSEKTVIETQEINNHIKPKTNILDIPPKNEKKSYVSYMFLGIIVIIILGIIISNNNHSNTSKNSEIPVDSSVVAIEIYNLGVSSDNENNFEDAERYYKKSLEINPNYYEANLNLALLILKPEDEIVREMNNLSNSWDDNNRYMELKSQREIIFKQALPYLEKAYEQRHDDQGIKSTLLQLYKQLEMINEYNNIKND